MSERTIADALVHAQMLRQFFEQSPHRGGISEREIVLLADEVLRLRKCPQCGCDHSSAYELGRADMQPEIDRMKAEIDGLKSGRYNKAINLTDQDLRGSYGE